MNIRIGSEQYAWVMAGCTEAEAPYYNKLDHMFRVCAEGKFQGFEPIDKFMFDMYDPERLKSIIAKTNVELSSVVLLEDWRHPTETDAEQRAADKLIDFLAIHFPKAVMMLCQMPTTRKENELNKRHQNLIACINSVSHRAADKGLICSYHPNSPKTSIWRTEEDYHKLLPLLDNRVLKWTPDVGHIARLNMNPRQLMADYQDLINHVHYKDMNADGSWALMGEGIIDFKGITQDLVANNYQGWIIVEDECPRSVHEPDKITVECGIYSQEFLLPLISQERSAS